MDRLRQRLAVARQALTSFKDLLRNTPATTVERDAAIQRFEYTVEAIWRLAQRSLDVIEGLSAGSPKAAIRLCRETGLLTDDETTLALEMVDDRNLTVHTYNEQLAQQIYSHLPQYATVLEAWLSNIARRLEPT